MRLSVQLRTLHGRCWVSTRARRTIFTPGAKTSQFVDSTPLHLELGGVLPKVQVAYETYGRQSSRDVVLLLPSLSMGCHAKSSVDDPSLGWWEDIIGPGSGIDTDRFRVICASNIGAPYGSTSPLTQHPDTGLPYRSDFPPITPLDIARVNKRLLQHLGVDRLHAVVGSSLGGCTALSFACEYPDTAERLVAVSCTARSSPGSVAFRHLQRQAILNDPNYRSGAYAAADVQPIQGMSMARQLGMMLYRSAREFNDRFDWSAKQPYDPQHLSWDIESYLMHKGSSFHKHYDANCYLTMSKCTDLMDLSRNYESFAAAIQRIQARCLIMGATADSLMPVEEQLEVYNILVAHGRDAKFAECSSEYGHDAFLLEPSFFLPRIRSFLMDTPIRGRSKKPWKEK